MSDQPPASVAIPLTEEELQIAKVRISTGKVRISTVVDATEEIVRATLAEENVDVARVPIG
jgi:stress response protein YsnF